MFWTAFILGLAGSLHCAGMCSPLAFAITNMSRSVWVSRLVYNLGRIFIYGILGAVVSTVGFILPIEQFQNSLSIGMGALLITIGFIGMKNFQYGILNRPVQKFAAFIKARFSQLIQRKSMGSFLLLGSLNGLLPCGLTLIALTTTIIMPTPLDGFYYMLFFGLGTLPVMLGFASIIQFATKKFRLSISKVNMAMLIIAGSLLIARVAFFHDHPEIKTETSTMVVCP